MSSSPTLSDMADPRPGLQFQEIWSSAITRYNQDTERDYLERGLVADSPDDLFVILDKEMNRFKQYRKRGERVRHAIRSVLELVNLSSGAIGDSLATVSTVSAKLRRHIPDFNDIRRFRQRKRFLSLFGYCSRHVSRYSFEHKFHYRYRSRLQRTSVDTMT